MNLESTIKHFSPKGMSISDTSRATASDALTGSDVMAAIGMCQTSAKFGVAAFMGKMNVSDNDKQKAIDLLTQYGMSNCMKVATFRKMSAITRVKTITVLATFAYADYCRSAAGVKACEKCAGSGFLLSTEEVMKHPGCGDKTPPTYVIEDIQRICTKCDGKGVISVACNDCRGRGLAVDRDESARQGIPVKKPCVRCSGRGYERLPASKAYRAIKAFIPNLVEKTFRYAYKPLYLQMISELEIQESYADRQLKKVTGN